MYHLQPLTKFEIGTFEVAAQRNILTGYWSCMGMYPTNYNEWINTAIHLPLQFKLIQLRKKIWYYGMEVFGFLF